MEEEWLCFNEDPDGRRGKQTSKRITLGVRSMIDLQRFISETWPDELCCEWYFPRVSPSFALYFLLPPPPAVSSVLTRS